MKYKLLVILSFVSFNMFSQLNAVTDEGKKVVLYNDGTWEYYQKPIIQVVDEKINLEGLNDKSDLQELYFDLSPRLERFFSSPKDKIRMKSQSIVENGLPKIYFQWEVYLGDGYRYYGYLKKEMEVNLNLKNGEKITLSINESLVTDFNERYATTKFAGLSTLSESQLEKVLQENVASVEVFWKKASETYTLTDYSFFKNSFSKLIKK